jgi:hypothetical protein
MSVVCSARVVYVRAVMTTCVTACVCGLCAIGARTHSHTFYLSVCLAALVRVFVLVQRAPASSACGVLWRREPITICTYYMVHLDLVAHGIRVVLSDRSCGFECGTYDVRANDLSLSLSLAFYALY